MENLCRRDVVKIDLNKGLSRSYAGMVLATGDKMANCFGAALYRGNEAVNITGYAVTGYFIRNSGSETVVIAGKAEGNEAVVELPQACYSSDGGFSLAIKVSGTDVTATVRVVDGTIRLTQTGVTIDPGEVIPSLDELFAQIVAMEQATDAAVGAADFANASGEQAYLLAQQATVSLTTQVNERLRRIAPPVIPEAVGDGVIVLTDSSENSFERLSIFGRTTQDSTPSPDNPAELVSIGAKGNIGLMVRGKNLLDIVRLVQTSERNGVTLTSLGGGFALKGTATGNIAWNYTLDQPLPAGRYVLHARNIGVSPTTTFYLADEDGTDLAHVPLSGNFSKTVFTSDKRLTNMKLHIASGTTLDLRMYPMLTVEDTDTFEGFKDGGSLTFIPPDEMRGIPVYSDGNYTDANGQQWICDEIDLARGVYVQRLRHASLSGDDIVQVVSTKTDTVMCLLKMVDGVYGRYEASGPLMCNSLPVTSQAAMYATGQTGITLNHEQRLYLCVDGYKTIGAYVTLLANHAFTVLYPLNSPIETPLPDDIMSAAMALKSLYPNTTIINDEGAGMSAAYVADTKNYIDQRIAALLNA